MNLVSGFGPHGFDIVMMIEQMAVGAFFAISGYHKLTNKERHARLLETLELDNVPFLTFNQWWVPSCEFAGGLALAMGVFTVLSSMLLLAICAVACFMDAPARVRAYKPVDAFDRLDDWLYLPEVLYVLLLVCNIAYGPTRISVDHYLLG